MPAQKFAVLLLLAMISYVLFDAQQYLSIGFFQSLYQQQPQITALTFFALYILVAGLSLPGAALLTMIGGIIFDFGSPCCWYLLPVLSAQLLLSCCRGICSEIGSKPNFPAI